MIYLYIGKLFLHCFCSIFQMFSLLYEVYCLYILLYPFRSFRSFLSSFVAIFSCSFGLPLSSSGGCCFVVTSAGWHQLMVVVLLSSLYPGCGRLCEVVEPCFSGDPCCWIYPGLVTGHIRKLYTMNLASSHRLWVAVSLQLHLTRIGTAKMYLPDIHNLTKLYLSTRINK